LVLLFVVIPERRALMIKYIVRLNAEEREQLLALVNTGRAAAAKLLHARILLKADDSDGGCRWSDADCRGLDTSESTVQRVRQAFVAWGWRRRSLASPQWEAVS
jgi:hypothetical protein